MRPGRQESSGLRRAFANASENAVSDSSLNGSRRSRGIAFLLTNPGRSRHHPRSMKAQADLSQKVRTLDHPLAFALLSLLRQKETTPNGFRPALQKLAIFLLIEAARGWETKTREMVSPLSRFAGQ